MANPTIKSYLEAGVQFTEMSKQAGRGAGQGARQVRRRAPQGRRAAGPIAGRAWPRDHRADLGAGALGGRQADGSAVRSVRRRRGQDRIADRVAEAQHQAVRSRRSSRRLISPPPSSAAEARAAKRPRRRRAKKAPAKKKARQEASGQEEGRQEGAGQEDRPPRSRRPERPTRCRRCGRHVGRPQGADAPAAMISE